MLKKRHQYLYLIKVVTFISPFIENGIKKSTTWCSYYILSTIGEKDLFDRTENLRDNIFERLKKCVQLTKIEFSEAQSLQADWVPEARGMIIRAQKKLKGLKSLIVLANLIWKITIVEMSERKESLEETLLKLQEDENQMDLKKWNEDFIPKLILLLPTLIFLLTFLKINSDKSIFDLLIFVGGSSLLVLFGVALNFLFTKR